MKAENRQGSSGNDCGRGVLSGKMSDQKKMWINHVVRYIISAGSSFLVDLGLFQVFVWLFKPHFSGYILLSTVLARILSSLYNFLMNKIFVFKNGEGFGTTAVRYYVLCICQMATSAGGVSLLYRILPFTESTVKFFVDIVLCGVSFIIQKRFVFRNDSGISEG